MKRKIKTKNIKRLITLLIIIFLIIFLIKGCNNKNQNIVVKDKENLKLNNNVINKNKENKTNNLEITGTFSKILNELDNRAHQKDKTVPEIEEVKVEVKSSRIILRVKARDDRTEVSKLKISYSIDGVNYTTNNIIKNLEQDKEYKVYVKVIDGAGNEVVKEEKVKTKKVEEVRNPVQNITTIKKKDVEVRVE